MYITRAMKIAGKRKKRTLDKRERKLLTTKPFFTSTYFPQNYYLIVHFSLYSQFIYPKEEDKFQGTSAYANEHWIVLFHLSKNKLEK